MVEIRGGGAVHRLFRALVAVHEFAAGMWVASKRLDEGAADLAAERFQLGTVDELRRCAGRGACECCRSGPPGGR